MKVAGAVLVLVLGTAAVLLGRSLTHDRATCGMCRPVDIAKGRSPR